MPVPVNNYRRRLRVNADSHISNSSASAIFLGFAALLEHFEDESRKDTQIHLLRDQVRRLGEEPEE